MTTPVQLKWTKTAAGRYETTVDGKTIELWREPYHRAIWSLGGDIATLSFDTKKEAQDWLSRRLTRGSL